MIGHSTVAVGDTCTLKCTGGWVAYDTGSGNTDISNSTCLPGDTWTNPTVQCRLVGVAFFPQMFFTL